MDNLAFERNMVERFARIRIGISRLTHECSDMIAKISLDNSAYEIQFECYFLPCERFVTPGVFETVVYLGQGIHLNGLPTFGFAEVLDIENVPFANAI